MQRQDLKHALCSAMQLLPSQNAVLLLQVTAADPEETLEVCP